jgi:hypothetical protein
MDLEQKFLVVAQVTLGLFLGVMDLVVMGDRVASTLVVLGDRFATSLDLWFGVDWWFMGLEIGVVVVMEGS